MTKAKAISELMVKKSLHANQVGVAILEQVAKTNPDLIRLMGAQEHLERRNRDKFLDPPNG